MTEKRDDYLCHILNTTRRIREKVSGRVDQLPKRVNKEKKKQKSKEKIDTIDLMEAIEVRR
jgi:hypothetical protein